MTRSRRRTHSRSTIPVVATVALLLVCAGALGAAGFSTGYVDRNSAVAVTSDTTGIFGIDSATSVHTNSTERLVTLTNRLDRDATVTVTLHADSTDTGSLVVDGTNHGTQATFTLATGASRRIEIEIPDDETLVGRTVHFRTEAVADGVYVSARNRTVPIEQ